MLGEAYPVAESEGERVPDVCLALMSVGWMNVKHMLQGSSSGATLERLDSVSYQKSWSTSTLQYQLQHGTGMH